MIKPGLVSITFRQLSPHEVIALAARAGLAGIEWGGDIHVPHGDTARARLVLKASREAGVDIAAYGSYYRIGHSEEEGLAFSHVLHTAIELEAPVIRVWAGTRNSEDADDDYFKLIVNETQHICEKAGDAGIRIAYEFHGNTLTNTAAATARLLEAVDHPNLRTLWQPAVGVSPQEALEGLKLLLPHVAHLHVFRWNVHERRPLAEGEADWKAYLETAAAPGRDMWGLLEFVEKDEPECLLRDAETLKGWLGK